MDLKQIWKKHKPNIIKSELDRYLETQEGMREHFRHTYYEGVARWCFTCKWFIYREEKPRNWVCRCPNEQLKFGKTPMGCDECFGWQMKQECVKPK